MKNIKAHKITTAEADRLIELYYEGLSTVEEENKLRNFLSSEKLPSKYEPEKAIFGFFEKKKQKPSFSLKRSIQWISVAAVVAIGFFSIQFWTSENINSYAYIDGIKTTDLTLIKRQAIASITELNSSGDIVKETFQQLNDKDIIQQQLDLFSSFE